MKLPDAWRVICTIGRIRNTYKERLYIKEFFVVIQYFGNY